jgi:pyruvate ferredoxin oxidoreductase delta subunit
MAGSEPKSWQELPIGGLILEAGNAEEYNTGNWRSKRPVMNLEECNSCLLCWFYCPDVSILIENGKVVGVDYEHCKGCGICAEVCPKKCIEMIAESALAQEGEG